MDRSSLKPERRPNGPPFPMGAYRSDLQEVFSLSRTLSVIGDRWSLQILTLCFLRFTRFGELNSALRINSPMLAARLFMDAGDLRRNTIKPVKVNAGASDRSGLRRLSAGAALVRAPTLRSSAKVPAAYTRARLRC
jgi:hypothetical protein